MVDLISRAAAITEVEQWAEHGYDVIHWTGIKAMLEVQPAVDAAPVVRCRDCKHRPTDNRGRDDDLTGFAIEFPDSRCPCQCEDGWYNWYPDDDWFCANGERRESE